MTDSTTVLVPLDRVWSHDEPIEDTPWLQSIEEDSPRNTLMRHYYKTDKRVSRIVDRLYLSSIGGALNKTALLGEGITHVMTVGANLPTPYSHHFKYHRVNLFDAEEADLLAILPSCIDFISEAIRSGHQNRVLVHCFAGRSRSVSVIAAYMMKEHHMNLLQALELMRFVRPQAHPNKGFELQLREYERRLQEAPSPRFWRQRKTIGEEFPKLRAVEDEERITASATLDQVANHSTALGRVSCPVK